MIEDGEPELLNARNDGLVNSFNSVQLSAWHANVDMQDCVSRHKVIEYCAKYATKSEPCSQPMKEIFAKIVRSLKDDNTSLKAVQKLLINSVGEKDYSAQETCHLLLQLPMFKASRDFTVLSLDGSRAVQEQLDEGQPATALSILDNYIARPATLPCPRKWVRTHPAGERMLWSLYVLTCLLNQTAPTMSSIVATD